MGAHGLTLPQFQGKFDQYIRDLEAMEENPCHQPTLVLYFKMPVEEALLRIKKRAEEEGRFFEKGIEESYLKLLEEFYETLYENREDRHKVEQNMSFCTTYLVLGPLPLPIPQLGGCGCDCN